MSILAAVSHRNVGLIIIPKCAMTSILRVLLGKYCVVTAEEFKLLPTRFAFWRQPHDRMESAWRQREPGQGFSTFVMRACADHGERHVRPQHELCADCGEYHIIRWNFAELAEILGVKSMPHENVSTPRPCQWSDEAREMFDRVYARDLELWAGNHLL